MEIKIMQKFSYKKYTYKNKVPKYHNFENHLNNN